MLCLVENVREIVILGHDPNYPPTLPPCAHRSPPILSKFLASYAFPGFTWPWIAALACREGDHAHDYSLLWSFLRLECWLGVLKCRLERPLMSVALVCSSFGQTILPFATPFFFCRKICFFRRVTMWEILAAPWATAAAPTVPPLRLWGTAGCVLPWPRNETSLTVRVDHDWIVIYGEYCKYRFTRFQILLPVLAV